MSKATDIIGGLGSVATSAINAWNGANPITGVSETANNINMLGNTLYAPGDLTNLSNQFTAATNIQTNGLLNRLNETFGLLFASGLNGMVAGQQLGNAMDGIKFTKKEEVDPASIVFNGYSQAYGGHLHSLGGDIAGLAGAVLNPALMAISGAVQDNKMNKLSDQFNVLSNLALQRNALNLSNAITDSTNMMFDLKAVQMKAYGGPLGCFWDTFDNGVRVIKEGGTHEENPHEGVQQGIAPDGLPNLVEEGEVIYNDFVYSDRLKLTKDLAKLFKLGGEVSFAEAALQISKESEERPNDIISKNGLRDSMNKLKVMQEELKAKNEQEDQQIANLILNALQGEITSNQIPAEQISSEETMMMTPEAINQMINPQALMFAKGGHLFEDGTPETTIEITPELQQQITTYKELLDANPTWSSDLILQEMFKVTEDMKLLRIADMRQKIIDRSVEIARHRTMPGISFEGTKDGVAPYTRDGYKKRLINSGFTEQEAQKETERAFNSKTWLSATCIATATDNIFKAMAEYFPLEFVEEIHGGKLPNILTSKWSKSSGNIFDLSVYNFRKTTPGTSDVYDVFNVNSDWSNLLKGDIITYTKPGNAGRGHAFTFTGDYTDLGQPLFSLSYGGPGPADVGEGKRGIPADSTAVNGYFTFDDAVSSNRGILKPENFVNPLIHRFTGNNEIYQYLNDLLINEQAQAQLSFATLLADEALFQLYLNLMFPQTVEDELSEELAQTDVTDIDQTNNTQLTNTKPAVKDKDGNVIEAAVPGHYEVIQGNGAQPLPQDHMADIMRMAPVWGSLAQSLQALSTKPNYQHLDAAIRAASQIPYVNYTPIGNYERFDRIDPNTQANALRAQYAQAIGNMLNSGASRAAINALQTNTLQGLASALSEAAQTGRTYNNTLKEKEIATQLGIDQALLNASLDASKTNQGRASAYAQMIGAMAPAKQAIDDAIETNKYTTQTAVANNLGNVGIDKLNRLMQQWTIERGVYPGVAPTKAAGGKLKYKTYRKKK